MIFISPLKVLVTKVKTWILNLNQYRNTHFRALNTCKINYKLMMEKQIKASPKYNKAICIYKVYPANHRSFDLGNVCCIHEKFFEDAFVEYGKLPDDNTEYIPLVIYMAGDIDKDNPRVEIEVLEFNKESIDKIVDMLYNVIGGK